MEFLKEIKSTLFIMSGLYLVIGLIMILAPGFVSSIVSYLAGTLCLIIGGLGIYIYISSEVYGSLAYGILITSVAMIVLGVFVVVDPNGLAAFLQMIIGLILVVDAFTELQSSSSLKRYNYSKWWAVMIFALLLFTFGIFLIVKPLESLFLLIRLMGFFLVVDSLSSMITARSYGKIEDQIK